MRRGTGCQPLAGDNAIAEEAMDGRRNDAEFRGRLLDVHKLARRHVLLRHEARDLPVRAQARYAIAIEAHKHPVKNAIAANVASSIAMASIHA